MSVYLEMGFSEQAANEAIGRFGDDLHAGCHWLMMRDDMGRIPKRLKICGKSPENTYLGSKIRYLGINWTVDKFDKKHALVRIRREDGHPSRWEHISDARMEWTSMKHEREQQSVPHAIWKRSIGQVTASLTNIDNDVQISSLNVLQNYIKHGRPSGNGRDWELWRAIVQLTNEFPHTPSRPKPRGVFSQQIHDFRVELMTYFLALCDVYGVSQNLFTESIYNDSLETLLSNFPPDVHALLGKHVKLWKQPQPRMHREVESWRKDCLPLIIFECSELTDKAVVFDIIIHDMSFVRPENYEPGVHMQMQRIFFSIFQDTRPSREIMGPMDSVFLRNVLHNSKKKSPLCTPASTFVSELFPYQRRCLNWLCSREMETAPSISSWGWNRRQLKDGFSFYTSVFGHISHVAPNTTVRGGILSQEVGMGKTVEILALIASNRKAQPTLVVVPTTMLGVWLDESKKHVPDLKVIKFHGPRRTKNMDDLRAVDIVVTTYRVVVNETHRHVPTIGSIRWGRIILDEAHELRAIQSATTRAVCRLYAPLRWCVSATPWPKGMTSVLSMLSFLNVSPFDEAVNFGSCSAAHLLLRHQQQDNPHLISNLLSSLTWWQRKRHVHLSLPPVSEQTVDLPNISADMYAHLLEAIRCRMSMDSADATVNARTRVMHYTRWARQAATHVSLNRMSDFGVPSFNSEQPSEMSTIDNFMQTLGHTNYDQSLRDIIESWRNGHETCTICMGVIERPTLTPCNHMFCHDCIQSSYQHDNYKKCPLCRKPAGNDVLNELTLEETAVEQTEMHHYITDVQGRDIILHNEVHSTLKNAIKRKHAKFEWLLDNIRKNEEKFILFTQFHNGWAKICEILTRNSISFVSIEGRMSPKQRNDAIHTFQNDNETRVFVMTTKTASVGITLTAGSHIVFLEPVENDSIKKQAVGRAWRIGQRRPVTVTTLRTLNTIDTVKPNDIMSHLSGTEQIRL
jgi:DNA repair protein RAD16